MFDVNNKEDPNAEVWEIENKNWISNIAWRNVKSCNSVNKMECSDYLLNQHADPYNKL